MKRTSFKRQIQAYSLSLRTFGTRCISFLGIGKLWYKPLPRGLPLCPPATPIMVKFS